MFGGRVGGAAPLALAFCGVSYLSSVMGTPSKSRFKSSLHHCLSVFLSARDFDIPSHTFFIKLEKIVDFLSIS